MVSLEKDHARLAIPKDEDFGDVSETVRMFFQLCRVNRLSGALIVSLQDPTAWRSCMRLAIRFSDSRGTLPHSKLALVVAGADSKQRDDVRLVAEQAGLACRVFQDEAKALAWLKAPGLRVFPPAA